MKTIRFSHEDLILLKKNNFLIKEQFGTEYPDYAEKNEDFVNIFISIKGNYRLELEYITEEIEYIDQKSFDTLDEAISFLAEYKTIH